MSHDAFGRKIMTIAKPMNMRQKNLQPSSQRMGQRGLIRRLLAVFVLIAAAAAYFFQPWSAHSPSAMTKLFSPEERVENHRNMKRIFPWRDIAASPAPFVFAKAETPLLTEFQYDGATKKVEEFLRRTQTTSFVVIKNGVIVSEKYFQGADEKSQFTSWSVAKSFLSTMVALAMKDGLIKSLDDQVEKYVPELKGKAYGSVTIQQLLQMSSGIKFDETYANKLSDINMLFYRVFLGGASINDVVSGYEREAPAGTRFLYVSSDSQVLGWVLSKVSGMSLSQYIQTRLWAPLGMESSAYWSVERTGGAEVAYCCVNATARDFAKLGQLYLDQGMWKGQQFLPEGWVKEATRPTRDYLKPEASLLKLRGYQYHWWVPVGYDGEYFANGVWGQMIWVSEKTKTVIVKTSVDKEYRTHLPETFAVMRALSAN
jgi:CubicO group peptidase (beta-lactamase class C family)